MTSIEQLLARALLLDTPTVPRDIVPRKDPGAAFLPEAAETRVAPDVHSRNGADRMAARDLRTLCETVLAHTTTACLQGFVTDHLPEPPGARVLGCILQLTDDEDSARAWWQYAAGAGDDTASYCLYLQHLTLGDTEAAAWWRRQTPLGARPAPEAVSHLPGSPEPIRNLDASFPTVLRVLTRLARADRPRTEAVDAVMHYVPGAVALGYIDNPDFELPLPSDFADHITILLAVTSAATAWLETRPRRGEPRLPGRTVTRARRCTSGPSTRGHR
ncbi:hypothetical protein A6A06_37650 [Streptomyces sp. CB02923]|uniref:hypothetical protein n=1 Tax=Streptomyces sp. CB02923 TaxID=1718985 RepID=UPI00093E16AA|nr:hypothetical protein [Streptomyces sp. CB02923]OKI06227.1 hypothetical protein A6A06_37650 [Streptomyces sp. CB02923]